MKSTIVILVIVSFATLCSKAQRVRALHLPDVVFVDTVEIDSPRVVRFDDSKNGDPGRVGHLLVPSRGFDSGCVENGVEGFYDCLTSHGFLFGTPGYYSCLLGNAIYFMPAYRVDSALVRLQNRIRDMSKDQVFVRATDGTIARHTLHGLVTYDVLQSRFWLFLVRNSALDRCVSEEEMRVPKSSNAYYRLLVPITR